MKKIDLIDRAEAIAAIDDLPNCPNGYSDMYDKARIIGVLEEVPAVVTRNSGRWGLLCCNCGYESDARYSYCPNCGSKMEG